MEKILCAAVWDNDLNALTDILISEEVEQWNIDHPNCKSRKLVPAFMLHDIVKLGNE